MTVSLAQRPVDLRRDPLPVLRAIDFRSPSRDYWADEAAIHDRFSAVWTGLDDAAWRLPGAAPSDAGGPDWSLLDHVGHVVDWWELATDYIAEVLRGSAWPADDDFDVGGDFDGLNERRRSRFAEVAPADLRARGAAAHQRVIALARQLPPETIRSDAAWGWVHQILHGHELDHLTVLEPWADALRSRQIGNDPFGFDPQPTRAGLVAERTRFWAAEAAILAAFREAIEAVPDPAWTLATDGDWTLADHVAHLAGWFNEGAAALEAHRAGQPWADIPAEGIDAFNARQVEAARATPPAELRAQFTTGLARLRAATTAMTDAEWLDPDGFSWAYEDLHGHVRAHHAMIGPWIARFGWPAPVATGPNR
ncbi:MAG: maleylpyruvate isomerase N-terminal domain-containing protein [Chloroflexi bacterium]|nr:maleylpyruvate isomerase N-terminal domain-containing protein [Chloroflexota bacterium]